jgi:hypothetical protein
MSQARNCDSLFSTDLQLDVQVDIQLGVQLHVDSHSFLRQTVLRQNKNRYYIFDLNQKALEVSKCVGEWVGGHIGK